VVDEVRDDQPERLHDSALYLKLFDDVSSCMIHVSCGSPRHESLCMKDGRCLKYYSRNFKETTTINKEG